MAASVVLDDRLLIVELLTGLPGSPRTEVLQTTANWYYRACRAAVAGGAGHLSGPFERLPMRDRQLAILSLLSLRDDIGLPDPRVVVPVMAHVARRHPRLNLLNLEAVAAATVAGATVWLSAEATAGVLPPVLDAEGIAWATIDRPSR